MAPASKLAETVKQVTKTLQSPGCRQAFRAEYISLICLTMPQEDPCFCEERRNLHWTGNFLWVREVIPFFTCQKMELTPLRMCPIFQTSNVTGEGLDYVGASSSSHLYFFTKYYSYGHSSICYHLVNVIPQNSLSINRSRWVAPWLKKQRFWDPQDIYNRNMVGPICGNCSQRCHKCRDYKSWWNCPAWSRRER